MLARSYFIFVFFLPACFVTFAIRRTDENKAKKVVLFLFLNWYFYTSVFLISPCLYVNCMFLYKQLEDIYYINH